VELDRNQIERKDFSAVRRGYDPDEVDRHLRDISNSVDGLKRTQRPAPASLATIAADQVRTIVEAAERSAAEIQDRAEREAREMAEEANRNARETRETADSQAAGYVEKVQTTTDDMLQRADSTEAEINRQLDSVRAAAAELVSELRTGAGSLRTDLESIRAGLSELREARPDPPAAVTPEPAYEPEPLDDEPSVAVLEDEPETAVAPDLEEDLEEPVALPEDEPVDEPTSFDETAVDPVAVEPVPEEPVEVEPELEEEPPAAAPASSGRSIAGAEGARLIALNMALNGTPRDETARYLSDNFELDEQDVILDEVYARVGG